MPAAKKPIHVQVRADLADELKAQAERRMLGVALLVEKALEMYLPTLLPIPESTPADPNGARP